MSPTPIGSVLKDGYGNRFIFEGQDGPHFWLRQLFGRKLKFKVHGKDASSFVVTGEQVKAQDVAKDCNQEDRRIERQEAEQPKLM